MLVKDMARKQASQLLVNYWDGALPVDPVTIADQLGIEVFTAELDRDESGRIVKVKGQPARIFVARGEPPTRQNFTCAHELGHWVERDLNGYDDYSFEDHRGQTPKDAREYFADWFAAELLMPAPQFRHAMSQGLSIEELAQRFGVSRKAAETRQRNLLDEQA